MSILIKGMDLPESCWRCPFCLTIDPDTYRCIPTGQEFESTFKAIDHIVCDCPLVEVVHCKDCTYMERGVKDSNEVWCCWHDSRMMESDFCSRGIKEQGDGNETH